MTQFEENLCVEVRVELARLNQLLTTSLHFLERDSNRHHDSLYGVAGDTQSPGLETRHDRLEQRDATRRWSLRTAIAAAATALAHSIYQLFRSPA